MTWDARRLPFLWVYGEFGATDDAPYHNWFYTLALQRFSRDPFPATASLSKSAVSHHFDYPKDESLGITDAYCFDGAGDRLGPRTAALLRFLIGSRLNWCS